MQLLGLIDVLRISKDASLFCQRVNALEWEKLECMQRARKRIQEVLVSQLESGQLLAADFPFLAYHAAELKTGMWKNEKLVVIPAAGGNAEKGFKFGLNNIKELCLQLSNNWFDRILRPSKVPKVYVFMAASLDMRKLIRPYGPNTAQLVAPSPSAAVEEENLGKLHDWIDTFKVGSATPAMPATPCALEPSHRPRHAHGTPTARPRPTGGQPRTAQPGSADRAAPGDPEEAAARGIGGAVQVKVGGGAQGWRQRHQHHGARLHRGALLEGHRGVAALLQLHDHEDVE